MHVSSDEKRLSSREVKYFAWHFEMWEWEEDQIFEKRSPNTLFIPVFLFSTNN